MGQMGNTFIIAEGPDGIYLIDQHRAHERVLFERLMDEASRADIGTQLLLEPLTLELTPRQMAVFPERLAGLSQMGFNLEPFGDAAVLIRAVPSLLASSDLAATLRELLDQAIDERDPGDWLEKITITMACKGAIKSGQSLSPAEMRELVIQLEQTSVPPTCPHGAPVMVHLSQAELEKQFGRR